MVKRERLEDLCMFCPNAADWGNVADWVSGAGSVIVGGGALYVAFMERRRAVRAEARASHAEIRAARYEDDRHNSLVSSGLRIIEILEDANQRFLRAVMDPDDRNAVKSQWINFVNQQNQRARRMLDFPHADPLLFAAFDSLVAFTDLPEGVNNINPADVAATAAELNEKLEGLKGGFDIIRRRTI